MRIYVLGNDRFRDVGHASVCLCLNAEKKLHARPRVEAAEGLD